MTTLTEPQRKALFNEAMIILDNANNLLTTSFDRCRAKVLSLKAADYNTLSAEDQHMLNAQLAHEAKSGIIVE